MFYGRRNPDIKQIYEKYYKNPYKIKSDEQALRIIELSLENDALKRQIEILSVLVKSSTKLLSQQKTRKRKHKTKRKHTTSKTSD